MAGWTKADRKAFLDSCDQSLDIMPKEVIVRQTSLFEGVISNEDNRKFQRLRFVLKYPMLDKNIKGDPMPKQSARFTVSRFLQGPKKGELIFWHNEKTGKQDVIIKSYQEAYITNTTKMLQEQLKMQLVQQKGYKFRGAIFITRMEFIFIHPSNAPQYMIRDLTEGNKIYFKETKPDLDNLEKLVWDAMEKDITKSVSKMENHLDSVMEKIVYDNDAQIVSKNGIFKRYGIRPGVIIEMEGYV